MRQRGAAERERVIPGSVWPSHDGELRRLWAEGLSSRIIANRMGVSKNAVLSRAHRLGLPQRAPGPQPEGPFAMSGPGIATVPKAARVVPAEIGQPVEATPLPVPLPIILTPSRWCLFPLWGDGVRAPRPPLFCGEPTRVRSYCDHHARIAFNHTRAESSEWSR